jgi:hypothetical protein
MPWAVGEAGGHAEDAVVQVEVGVERGWTGGSGRRRAQVEAAADPRGEMAPCVEAWRASRQRRRKGREGIVAGVVAGVWLLRQCCWVAMLLF